MKRLIVGSLVSVPLMLTACSGDPTESLRNGVAQLTTSPSELFVQQNLTAKVRVSAIDEQGNQIVTSFDTSDVGSGIAVSRDLTFQPLFVNDSTLQPPAEAAVFQFNVTPANLVATSFKLNAGGKSVDVPVTVTPDPDPLVNPAVVTTAGATSADPATITVAAPLIFTDSSAVVFDSGAAIITDLAADGSTITFLPPPAATSAGLVSHVSTSYLPAVNVSLTTNVPVVVSPTITAKPNTGSPATAPDITATPAFFDVGTFTGADITDDGGLGAQYYKLTVAAAAGDTIPVTIRMDAQRIAAGTDMDLVLCSDVTCSDGGDFSALGSFDPLLQPEEATYSLVAGTYYIAVVFFAGTTPPPSISLQVIQ